ncbi:hypothetical protein, partial [Anaerophaga thermohalophila]|uniref:hypothetical protein n=1 Tax=Anaerophaga thermohalophila TaxID=177400 RepID=UPI0005C50AF9
MKKVYLVLFGLILGLGTGLDAFAQQTWYALNSGEWNNPDNWTLDPAAAIHVTEDEGYPLEGDDVVIKSGRTITMPTQGDPFSANCNVLTVNGRLDLKNTSGHIFTEIRGSGRIIMEGDNFPSGNASNFVDEGKGTVVFKGNGYTISNHTFYNVEIDLEGTNPKINLAGNLTVNGDFSVLNGNFQFGNNTTSRTLTVDGDITVNNGASMTVNTANAAHYLYSWGNITNNGTIQFTNLPNPDYDSAPTDGYVILTVKGESNTTLTANNTTFLQRLIIDKGSDRTYRFTVNPSQREYFRLFGQNNNAPEDKALYIINGTLELTGATYIHSLTEGGNDFYVPETGGLWINGGAVEVNSTAVSNNADGFTSTGVEEDAVGSQSFSVLGKFRISDGVLNTHTHGFVAWDSGNALVQIEGGTILTPGFRSAGGHTGKWTYNQSGGTVYMYGDLGSDLSGSGEATFSVKGTDNVYIMSGGTMEIQDAATGNELAIDIQSGEGKYSVTGGTVKINRVDGASDEFSISSTAPFYNLEIAGDSSVATALLNSELTVLNDLIINKNGVLDVTSNNYALNIGGNLILCKSSSNLNLRSNTTSFIGEGNSFVKDSAGVYPDFYTFHINKENITDSVSLSDGDVIVQNDLIIERGVLNLNDNKLTVNSDVELGKGNIYTPTISDGRIVLTGGSASHQLNSYSEDYSMGHVELNDGNGAIFLSDIRFDFFTLTNGVVDITKYKMRVDTSLIGGSGFSSSKMIKTSGKSSDKGLQYNFSMNQIGDIVYPVGVDVGYVPVTLTINNAKGVSGEFGVIPVPEEHPATNPSFGYDVLPFYWKTKKSGFSPLELEDVSIRFDYYQPVSFGHNCRSYLNYDGEWYYYEDIGSTFDHLTYQNIGEYIEGDFTAAEYDDRFGDLAFLNYDTYFSRNGGGEWTARNTWSFDGHDGGKVGWWDVPPGPEDIVIIGDNDSVYINSNGAEAAQVTIFSGSVLDINSTENHDFSEIKGSGKFRASTPNIPNANFGEFVTNDTAIFEYYGSTNYTLTTQLSEYPNLVISGAGNKTISNIDLKIKSLFVDDALLNMSNSQYGDLEVEDDVTINTGQILFRNNGTERELTVNGDINIIGGGGLIVQNADAETLKHNLVVHEDLSQGNGIINLYNTNNGQTNTVTVNFIGDKTSEFTKTGSGISSFGRIVIDKQVADSVRFKGDFSLNAPNNTSDKPLSLIAGIVDIDNSAINIELSSGGGMYKIPAESELIINQGTVSLGGSDPDGAGIWLDGKLTINDGGVANFNQGTDNYIEYTASGTSEIEVNGSGELYVGSQIRRSPYTEAGILKFSQNSDASTIKIGTNDAGETTRGVFEILNTGSSFTQAAGATLTIKNSKTGGFTDFYFDPESVSLGEGSTIEISAGNEASDPFDMFVNQSLENLTFSGDVEGKLNTVPVEILGNLSIGTNSVFNANGLDVTIQGDMTNEGSYNPNENTTYFSGLAGQSVTGNTNFYNLVKNAGTDTLRIGETSAITIANDFTLNTGIFSTGENDVSVEGDFYIAEGAFTVSGSGSNGVVLNGTSSQELSGGGTIARLMVDNAAGVVVPTQSSATTFSDVLKLNNGILDIGRNLLVLTKDAVIEGDASGDFSSSNMVQTNLSFTDAGIKKYYPTGAVSNFIYPIGASGKYTPVVMNITSNGTEGGSIRVKAANEPHITIPVEDLDNVLQYNWTLDADGISNFTANVAMHGYPGDVPGTNGDEYITARILDEEEGIWNKYSVDDFDEINTILNFSFDGTNDAGIDGDYTAGTDEAIPDKVQTFVTEQNGYWDDPAVWSVVGGGVVPGGGPKGAIVQIKHAVDLRVNGHEAYMTGISGTGVVDVGNTLNHRLGKVSGTGTVVVESGSLPAGEYTEFFSENGGTLEYSGSTNYSVLAELPQVNNLAFSGSGNRILPNLDIDILGDFTIEGGNVINEESRLLTIHGDMSRTGGSFDSRQGVVKLQGDEVQTINGSFTDGNALYNLEVDNVAGLTLNGPVDVENKITFTNGVVTTSETALLTILNSANAAVDNASRLRYVNGPMQKKIVAGTMFDFPVGDDYRYGNIGVKPATTGLWTAQYFDHAASADGYPEDGVTYVSQNEYWRVEAANADNAEIKLRWDSESGVNPDSPDFLVISYEPSAWSEVNYDNKTGDISGGSIITETLYHDTERLFTFGSGSIAEYTWLGTNGTDWFDGGNWAGGLTPSAANPVKVDNLSSSNNPVIGENMDAYCSSLTIETGKTVTLKPGSSLEITNDVNNSGTIILESTNSNLSSLMLPDSPTNTG